MPGPHFDAGLYAAKVVAQGFDVSKEKRTPFFWLAYEPLCLVNAEGDDIGQCARDEREVRLYITDGTIENLLGKLRYLGWNGSSWSELEPGGSHSFVGQEIIVECRHEQVNERVYERWELPGSRRQRSEAVQGVARKLDTLFGRQTKAVAPTPPARHAEAKAAQEAPKARRGRPPKAAAPIVAEARDESEAGEQIPF